MWLHQPETTSHFDASLLLEAMQCVLTQRMQDFILLDQSSDFTIEANKNKL